MSKMQNLIIYSKNNWLFSIIFILLSPVSCYFHCRPAVVGKNLENGHDLQNMFSSHLSIQNDIERFMNENR